MNEFMSSLTLTGKWCHGCSIVTIAATVVALLRCERTAGNYGQGETATAETALIKLDCEMHCRMSLLVFVTAGCLELFGMIAQRFTTVQPSGEGIVHGKGLIGRLSDQAIMLVIYGDLITTYAAMGYFDSFGSVHTDPFAGGRPVYSVRYLEWCLNCFCLMTLVGRAVPRKVAADLDPAILLTVVYVTSSWVALIVESHFWRLFLIFLSFVAYGIASWAQFVDWVGSDEDMVPGSPHVGVAKFLVCTQVVLFGYYGVVYLLAAYDLITPLSEQVLYTYTDATTKLSHSVFLVAIRRQLNVKAVHDARLAASTSAGDMERLIDTSNAPILSVDLEGKVVIWNQKIAALAGLSPEAAKGMHLSELVTEECREDVLSAIKQCIEGKVHASAAGAQFPMELLTSNQYDYDDVASNTTKGTASEMKRSMSHSDRLSHVSDEFDEEDHVHKVLLSMNVTALHCLEKTGGKLVVGVVGVGQDVTEVTHFKAVEEKKSRFMAVMSHELRSPLHGVIGLVTGLEGSEEAPERKRQLGMVKGCAARLLDLVVNIMEMSSMDAEKRGQSQRPYRREAVNLPQILDEVCALVVNSSDKSLKPLVDPSKVKLRNAVKAKRVPTIEGDAFKITQVLYNLLTNSAKFTTKGSITLTCRSSKSQRVVEVEVTDTGVGIAGDSVKRVFEPFEQENNSESRNYQGVGLGLAISREIVRRHGGDITVKSKLGKGSTFTMRLPFEPPLEGNWVRTETSRSSPPDSTVAKPQRNNNGSEHSYEDDSDLNDDGSDSSGSYDGGGTLCVVGREEPKEAVEAEAWKVGASFAAGQAAGQAADAIQAKKKLTDALTRVADLEAELEAEKKKWDKNASGGVGGGCLKNGGSSDGQRGGSQRKKGASLSFSTSQDNFDAKGGSSRSLTKAGRKNVQDAASVATSGQVIRVLSVDDDAVNQEVIKGALCDPTKYRVDVCMDGFEALDFLNASEVVPDIVLLDIMMPGMDGFEVCTHIRTEMSLGPSDLPVIMLSAREPAPASVIQGLVSGSNDYMVKPFNTEVLKARIANSVKLKVLHDMALEHASHLELLHEIMPPHIVERLVQGETAVSESHSSVTILFSDIVGWTNIAEALPTQGVVRLLNHLFSAFDQLTDKFDVFKVETIGDAYMCASGHDGATDHALRLCRFGLEMLAAVKAVPAHLLPKGMRLRIRVGLHTGPAHTGVVGTAVPRYCFFGDTINVSSRMESHGLPGSLHLSAPAWDHLLRQTRAEEAPAAGGCGSPRPDSEEDNGATGPGFLSEALGGASLVNRGIVEVKGKGPMSTHLIYPKGSVPLQPPGSPQAGAVARMKSAGNLSLLLAPAGSKSASSLTSSFDAATAVEAAVAVEAAAAETAAAKAKAEVAERSVVALEEEKAALASEKEALEVQLAAFKRELAASKAERDAALTAAAASEAALQAAAAVAPEASSAKSSADLEATAHRAAKAEAEVVALRQQLTITAAAADDERASPGWAPLTPSPHRGSPYPPAPPSASLPAQPLRAPAASASCSLMAAAERPFSLETLLKMELEGKARALASARAFAMRSWVEKEEVLDEGDAHLRAAMAALACIARGDFAGGDGPESPLSTSAGAGSGISAASSFALSVLRYLERPGDSTLLLTASSDVGGGKVP